MRENEYQAKRAEASYNPMGWSSSPEQSDRENTLTRDDFFSDLRKASQTIKPKDGSKPSETSAVRPSDGCNESHTR